MRSGEREAIARPIRIGSMLNFAALHATTADPRTLAAAALGGTLTVGLIAALAIARRTARRAVAAQRESDSRLQALVASIQEGVLIRDERGEIVLANDQALEILGLTLEQLSGREEATGTWQAFHEDGAEWGREEWPSNVALREGKEQKEQTVGIRMPWGETTWLSVRAVPLVRPAEARAHSVVTLLSDVTVRKRREERNRRQAERAEDANAELARANALLADMALTDGLTGLKNYRAFQSRLADEVETSRREDRPLSLILLDVDEFKAYNDLFGHPEGDEALRKVAGALRSIARGTDLVARYGGEEFAVVLPDVDEKGALAVAERLRAAVQGTPWAKRAVTASFGVSTLRDGDDVERLVSEADEALYRAKRDGRNRVQHANDTDGSRYLVA